MIKKNKPILFATLGLPGAGKTTFCRKFARELHLVYLNSDRIRKAMFGKPKYTQLEHDLVYPVMDALAEDALVNGLSVIYDANSSRYHYREALMSISKKCRVRFFLLRFQTPEAVAKKRLATRKRCTSKICQDYHPPVPIKDFIRIKNSLEEPTSKEPTVYINGTDIYAKQKKTVLERLSQK